SMASERARICAGCRRISCQLRRECTAGPGVALERECRCQRVRGGRSNECLCEYEWDGGRIEQQRCSGSNKRDLSRGQPRAGIGETGLGGEFLFCWLFRWHE